MSKIAIFSFSPVIVNGERKLLNYYEAISLEFQKRGHRVLNLITNNFIVDPWNGENTPISNDEEKRVLSSLKKFNPDLIISFNNSKLDKVVKFFDCPIVICEADTPEYFSSKKDLKRNSDRYYYFYFTKNGKKKIISQYGASEKKIFYISNATAVKNKAERKINDIVFIGTLYDRFKIESKKNKINFLNYRSSIQRYEALKKLDVFNLKIYTNRVPSLYLDFKNKIETKPIYSLQQLEKIYNSSLIGFNISHAQAKNECYSWRVLDILASNALLMCEENNFLKKDFGKKISRQLYSSKYDLYKKVKFILKNKNFVKDQVCFQNDIINKKFRWKQRIQYIESIFNLKVESSTKNKIRNQVIVLNRNTKIKYNFLTKFIGNLIVNLLYKIKQNKKLNKNILRIKFFIKNSR